MPELHKRLRWVALVVIAAFALLIGRLWQLQVMRGESYFERTVSNVVKERYLPSVRGKIVDSKGTSLADNRPAFNIYATPKQFKPETSWLRFQGNQKKQKISPEVFPELPSSLKLVDPKTVRSLLRSTVPLPSEKIPKVSAKFS